MRHLLAAAMVLVASTAHAEIRITNDKGGIADDYQWRVDQARHSGERVVIDGPCYSACTMYLTLPAHQVCATPRGMLGFHWAVDAKFGLPNPAWNDALLKAYPPKVRYYILERGGLWMKPIYVRANHLIRPC